MNDREFILTFEEVHDRQVYIPCDRGPILKLMEDVTELSGTMALLRIGARIAEL